MLADQGVAELVAEASDVRPEGLVGGRCHRHRVFSERTARLAYSSSGRCLWTLPTIPCNERPVPCP